MVLFRVANHAINGISMKLRVFSPDANGSERAPVSSRRVTMVAVLQFPRRTTLRRPAG